MGLSDTAKEKARQSRKRYDEENMTNLATKLPTAEANAFRQYAVVHDTTVSRLFAEYVRRTLADDTQGGDNMADITGAVDTGKKTTQVSYDLWQTTIDGMAQIAKQSGVTVDLLVNGVLCEFINTWTHKTQA